MNSSKDSKKLNATMEFPLHMSFSKTPKSSFFSSSFIFGIASLLPFWLFNPLLYSWTLSILELEAQPSIPAEVLYSHISGDLDEASRLSQLLLWCFQRESESLRQLPHQPSQGFFLFILTLFFFLFFFLSLANWTNNTLTLGFNFFFFKISFFLFFFLALTQIN